MHDERFRGREFAFRFPALIEKRQFGALVTAPGEPDEQGTRRLFTGFEILRHHEPVWLHRAVDL